MLTEFEDVFPTDQPGIPPERSVAMEIDLEEGAKPVAKPAFRLCIPVITCRNGRV
jgi:hypothetical protein